MEEMIKEEVAQFKQLIDKNISQPFNFMGKLNLPILNALWKVLVGERFEYDNPRLIDIVKRLSDAFEIFARPSQVQLKISTLHFIYGHCISFDVKNEAED